MNTFRINKRIADLKLASRREADALIEAGKVLVNGSPATLGQKVSEDDTIEIKGQTKNYKYLAYYKGRGVITHSPADGEIDIATKLKTDYGLTDVYPVGRLDKDSEGLMLLTNDGRVTGPLLDPEANHEKVYEVTVDKLVAGSFLKKLENGVDIEGYVTKKAKAKKLSDKRFSLTITEGKKHQIRRMCAALGYQVQSLKRIKILDIELGQLKPNQYRNLQKREATNLLQQLNLLN